MSDTPTVRVMTYREGESYFVRYGDGNRHEVTREGKELVCFHLKADCRTRGPECKGYKYRRGCRHIDAVRSLLPGADLAAAHYAERRMQEARV